VLINNSFPEVSIKQKKENSEVSITV